MKRETFILRLAVFLIGIPIIALCVFGLPSIARGATEHYPRTVVLPIMAGVYANTVPYFIALHQTFLLLGYIDVNKAFSELSVNALRNIKRCAVAITILFSMAGLPLLYLIAEVEDAPGLIIMGLAIPFASIVVAVFAAVLQRLLMNAIEIKSENDLTV